MPCGCNRRHTLAGRSSRPGCRPCRANRIDCHRNRNRRCHHNPTGRSRLGDCLPGRLRRSYRPCCPRWLYSKGSGHRGSHRIPGQSHRRWCAGMHPSGTGRRDSRPGCRHRGNRNARRCRGRNRCPGGHDRRGTLREGCLRLYRRPRRHHGGRIDRSGERGLGCRPECRNGLRGYRRGYCWLYRLPGCLQRGRLAANLDRGRGHRPGSDNRGRRYSGRCASKEELQHGSCSMPVAKCLQRPSSR